MNRWETRLPVQPGRDVRGVAHRGRAAGPRGHRPGRPPGAAAADAPDLRRDRGVGPPPRGDRGALRDRRRPTTSSSPTERSAPTTSSTRRSSSPGDVVVSIVPTYQQHTSIPESLGAEVRLLRLREERRVAAGPRRASLARRRGEADRPGQPQQPDRLAPRRGRPSRHRGDRARTRARGSSPTRSTAASTRQGPARARRSSTSTSGRSASAACPRRSRSPGCGSAGSSRPREVLDAVSRHRDYSVISVGMVDDLLASIALEARDALLARNRAIVRENLAILDAWVAREPRISYVKPRAGHHRPAALRRRPPVRGAVRPPARGRGRDVHAGQRDGHGGLPADRLRERAAPSWRRAWRGRRRSWRLAVLRRLDADLGSATTEGDDR